MAVVERRLHDRKEVWFSYLVCKNNEFFAWRKTDTALRTANWLRLNITVHQKFRNGVPLSFHKRLRKIKPLSLNSKEYGQTIWIAMEGQHCISRHHGRLFHIIIQYPHFFLVVQSPFDNWHSSFSLTTFFEIDIYENCLAKKNRSPEAAGILTINLKLRPALSIICAIKGKARNCCTQKSNGKEES